MPITAFTWGYSGLGESHPPARRSCGRRGGQPRLRAADVRGHSDQVDGQSSRVQRACLRAAPGRAALPVDEIPRQHVDRDGKRPPRDRRPEGGGAAVGPLDPVGRAGAARHLLLCLPMAANRAPLPPIHRGAVGPEGSEATWHPSRDRRVAGRRTEADQPRCDAQGPRRGPKGSRDDSPGKQIDLAELAGLPPCSIATLRPGAEQLHRIVGAAIRQGDGWALPVLLRPDDPAVGATECKKQAARLRRYYGFEPSAA